ncbi:MAG: fimbria major subunit [Muribaculaceae bacterium]|nr:fimbria major subunit [Muribaculaceae bacterium]
MKKIYGFAALCAAMTLASCSNNDEPIVPGSSVDSTASAVGGYLSVNIANANKGTRADHDNFVYGTEAESKASKASFIYFDAEGNFVGISKSVDLTATTTPDPNTTPYENVERDYHVMVDVKVDYTPSTDADENKRKEDDAATIKAKVDKITQVIAVLNPGNLDDYLDGSLKDGDTNDKVIKTIDDVVKVVNDYATNLTSINKFVMTNSVYWDDTTAGSEKLVYTSSCLDANGNSKIKNNAANAAETPVSIYVERVVSRVDAAFADNFVSTYVVSPTDANKAQTGAAVEIGTYNEKTGLYEYALTQFDIKVTGIEIANVAKKSYLVKNMGTDAAVPTVGVFSTTNPFKDWNASGFHRSHWAFNTAATANASRKSSEQTTSDFVNHSYNVGFTPFTFTSGASSQPKFVNNYINENTNGSNKTALVVSAELVKHGTNETVDLVRVLRNGEYYTMESAKKVLLDLLQREGYMVKEEVTPAEGEKPATYKYVSINVGDVDFVSANNLGYDGYLQLTSAVNYTKRSIVKTVDGGTNFTDVTKDTFNGHLQTPDYQVWRWNNGKCYYYVELITGQALERKVTDENGDDVMDGDKVVMEKVGEYGVVRNHIYDLTLRTMVGLGVPVFDPTEIIVPVTPPHIDPKDEPWKMACDIHILSWGSYHQDVDFNNGQDNY